MGASLPFPPQPRAGFEAGSGSQTRLLPAPDLLGDIAQPAVQFGSEPTQRLFLQAVGDGRDQQVSAEPSRGLGSIEPMPLRAQVCPARGREALAPP